MAEQGREALEAWKKMSEEARIKYIKDVLDVILKEAKESKMQALMDFTRWLSSEEGAVAFPHIWKPQYREEMVRIAYNGLIIAGKVMYLIMGNG